jgi:hypothetical protein
LEPNPGGRFGSIVRAMALKQLGDSENAHTQFDKCMAAHANPLDRSELEVIDKNWWFTFEVEDLLAEAANVLGYSEEQFRARLDQLRSGSR